jgi:hypothetical protein
MRPFGRRWIPSGTHCSTVSSDVDAGCVTLLNEIDIRILSSFDLLIGLDQFVELVGIKPDFAGDAECSELARLYETVNLFLTEL